MRAILVHVKAPVMSRPGEMDFPGSSMAEKIAAYPVLKVFRRYASFRVALGFAQAPRQFARIPEQRFQPPAEGLYVLGSMVFSELFGPEREKADLFRSTARSRRRKDWGVDFSGPHRSEGRR
jgi:hypothetical protein